MSARRAPYLVVDACLFSANYNYCLLDGLARNHEDIVYATTRFPYEELPDPPGVAVMRCFFFLARAARTFTASTAVRRLLRGGEYPLDLLALLCYVVIRRIRVVHFMWAASPSLDLWIIRLLRRLGRKVVLTAHNPLPHECTAAQVRAFARIYRQVDHIIVLSEYSRQELIGRAGIPADKITVVPHGDFGTLFATQPANAELVAEVRRQAAGRSVVGFLGHVRPYKGLEYFIDAIPQIRRLQPQTFFVIAGSVLVGDPLDVQARLSASCDPQDRILDLRYLPLGDLMAYVAVTDVLVQPYVRASQSGNTAMALAAGVPVVSTDVGGLGETIEHGATGYLVPPRDAAAIARAVAECLTGDNRLRMGENARRFARDRYDWSVIAERTARVYRQVAAK